MDVADEILNVRVQPIREWEDSNLFYIVLVRRTLVGVVVIVEHAMWIRNNLTPVLTILRRCLFWINFLWTSL